MWMWEDIDIEYLGRYGYELPPELQKDIEGMSLSETAVYFKERFSIPESLEEIKSTWMDMARDKYTNKVPLKPGAREFLVWLRQQGIRTGIASSNGIELVETVLKAQGIQEYLESVHTCCEVPKGKPAPDMSVTLSGLKLDNPVVPASGTFGYGNEFRDFYDINILGSFSFKGTTREPRFGNPTPRIAECTAGMINAVGLQNPGIDAVIAEELPRLKSFFHKPVIANISGFSIEEYAYCCERIDREEQVGIIEVNVSCPNVRHGGMSFGTSPECAAEVTRAVKAVTTKPVYIKLSPNVTDIVSIARACEEAGADGICLINTLLGMRIDVRCRKAVIANTMGGFSGAAVFPVAVRMVYQVAKACSVPVMGCGGVTTARDVIEMMMAGATAVQVGAANLANPYASKEIVEALPAEMQRLGIGRLSDIIGIVE